MHWNSLWPTRRKPAHHIRDARCQRRSRTAECASDPHRRRLGGAISAAQRVSSPEVIMSFDMPWTEVVKASLELILYGLVGTSRATSG